MADTEDLLLLVSVLAQALFTLVRRHLMSLSLFSARHIQDNIWILFLLLDCVDEYLGRLEGGNIVCRDSHSGPLGNVTSSLLCPVLDDEATKSTKINRLLPDDRTLNGLHESLDYGLNCDFLNTG